MSCGTKAYWLLFEYLVVPHTIYLPLSTVSNQLWTIMNISATPSMNFRGHLSHYFYAT